MYYESRRRRGAPVQAALSDIEGRVAERLQAPANESNNDNNTNHTNSDNSNNNNDDNNSSIDNSNSDNHANTHSRYIM